MDAQNLTASQIVSNVVILDKIFQYLSPSDLKCVRLVSHLWENISYPMFQRRVTVRLGGNIGNSANTPQTEIITRFLVDFSGSRCPFRKFKLCNMFFFRDSDEVLAAFWEKFGPSMETLELSWVRVVGVENIRDILFNFCPNLKRISIKECTFYETYDNRLPLGHSSGTFFDRVDPLQENARVNLTKLTFSSTIRHSGPSLPVSWEEIFSAYPNLRDLSFYNIDAAETHTILEKAKSRKMRTPSCLQLDKLNIFKENRAIDDINPDTMNRLLSLQLCLKELSIDLGDEVNHQQVAQLLQQQRNVKKLTLFRGLLAIPMTQFPFQVQFGHLNHLQMTNTITDSLKFLKFMPNLTTLIFHNPHIFRGRLPYRRIELFARTDTNFAGMPKLTTLKIEYDITTEDVRKLVDWFPGVVRAKLDLDNEGFRSVCQGWHNLEELEILRGNLTTEGITGISETKVGNSKLELDYNPINITSLSKLRKFVMSNLQQPVAIKDLCVDKGFLKLGYLNYLDICSDHISNEGWAKLFNWSQLLTLKASNGNEYWEGVESYNKCI